MTTFSYSSGNPSNLTGGHSASMSDISGPLTDIPTFLNGNIDTTNLATSAKPVTLLGEYRALTEAWALYSSSIFSTTTLKFFQFGGFIDSGGSLSTATNIGINVFAYDPADYAVSGLTPKLRLRCAMFINSVAPARTFTFGMYPVTVAGAANTVALTGGTVVTGSTAAIVSPSASTITQAVGTDFTLPVAGAYALGVVLSGAVTANSGGLVYARLDMHHV